MRGDVSNVEMAAHSFDAFAHAQDAEAFGAVHVLIGQAAAIVFHIGLDAIRGAEDVDGDGAGLGVFEHIGQRFLHHAEDDECNVIFGEAGFTIDVGVHAEVGQGADLHRQPGQGIRQAQVVQNVGPELGGDAVHFLGRVVDEGRHGVDLFVDDGLVAVDVLLQPGDVQVEGHEGLAQLVVNLPGQLLALGFGLLVEVGHQLTQAYVGLFQGLFGVVTLGLPLFQDHGHLIEGLGQIVQSAVGLGKIGAAGEIAVRQPLGRTAQRRNLAHEEEFHQAPGGQQRQHCYKAEHQQVA